MALALRQLNPVYKKGPKSFFKKVLQSFSYIYHKFPFTRRNYANLLCYAFKYLWFSSLFLHVMVQCSTFNCVLLKWFNAYDNEFLPAASLKVKEWKCCLWKSLFWWLLVKCLKYADGQQTLNLTVSQDCTWFLSVT